MSRPSNIASQLRGTCRGLVLCLFRCMSVGNRNAPQLALATIWGFLGNEITLAVTPLRITSEYLATNTLGDDPTKTLWIHLPAGYETSDKHYPVVYWFPGGGQSQTSGIETGSIDDEFLSGRSSEAIIVFMQNNSSFGSSTYLSSDTFGDWQGFLTKEVIPLIDNTYRTIPTADKRAAMGFSLGGFTSLMSTVLSPNTFGAVGVNDSAVALIASFVRDIEEIPADVPIDDEVTISDFLAVFPDSATGYGEVPPLFSAMAQVGAWLSPSTNPPMHVGDLPFDELGEWIPDVRETWRQFDLIDPAVVARNLDAFKSLATVSVILPQDEEMADTAWNREMVRVLREAGVASRGISFPGSHSDFRNDRFVTLLSDVTYAMQDATHGDVESHGFEQNFDQLGFDDRNGIELPSGWSVSDHDLSIFRDRTNTAFAGGDIELEAHAHPYILNAGESQGVDRALAVSLPDEPDATILQFVANTHDLRANRFELEFDLEVWDQLAGAVDGEQITLGVSLELDQGNGWRPAIDLGSVVTAPLQTGSGSIRDGNQPGNSFSFESGLIGADLSNVKSLRLRWTAEGTGDNSGWVIGLDNVTLRFTLLGDFDMNRQLEAADLDRLTAAIRSGTDDLRFDVNGDSLIDVGDRLIWITDLAETSFGDANLDGAVDFGDFLLLADHFAREAGWGEGDFDGSGTVDLSDFLILRSAFVDSNVAQAVPEPSSFALLVTLLPCWRRRGRSKSAI